MKKVELKDIAKEPYENWNHYKYEKYNGCPICGERIHMQGQVNEYQKFICVKCEQEFILNAITEEIELLKKEENKSNLYYASGMSLVNGEWQSCGLTIEANSFSEAAKIAEDDKTFRIHSLRDGVI